MDLELAVSANPNRDLSFVKQSSTLKRCGHDVDSMRKETVLLLNEDALTSS